METAREETGRRVTATAAGGRRSRLVAKRQTVAGRHADARKRVYRSGGDAANQSSSLLCEDAMRCSRSTFTSLGVALLVCYHFFHFLTSPFSTSRLLFPHVTW
jgi:hypothetical protein